MSVLTIRAHKRYATRLPVKLQRGSRKAMKGLMIELSQTGARISNLGKSQYEVGDTVQIVAPNKSELRGTIRWAHDGLAGVRLENSLHLPEMRELLELNRQQQGEEPRYGT